MNLKKTIISNSILYFLSMVIPKASSFVAIPIYSYYLKPDQFAILTYTHSVTVLLAVFSQMGFNAYWFRNYSSSKNKREHNGAMFWFMFLWSSIMLLVSLILLPIVWRVLHISIPFWPYMVMSLITNYLTCLDHIPMRMFRVQDQVYFYLIRMVTRSLMSVGLGLLFVVVFKYGIFGRFLAELLVAIIFGIFFIIYMIKNAEVTINWNKAKQSLLFSIPIVTSSFFRIGANSASTVIAEKLLNMNSLGIFGMAKSLIMIVQVFVQSIGLTIEPEIFLRKNKTNFPEQFLKIKSIAMIIVGCIAFGSALFVGDLIVIFLSDSYWSSWRLFQLLAFFLIIEEDQTMLCNLIVAQGNTNSLNWIYGSKLLFIVPFLYVSLTLFNESGIIIAMIASSLVSLIITIRSINRSSIDDLGIVRDMIFISIGIIIITFCNLLHDSPIIPSLIIKFVSMVLFVLLSLRMYKLKFVHIYSMFLR